MTDFPEKITMQSDITFNPKQPPDPKNPFGFAVSSQQYIRADLVPQWKKMESAPYGERVLVLDRRGFAHSASVEPGAQQDYVTCTLNGYVYSPDYFSHWMEIPKVGG